MANSINGRPWVLDTTGLIKSGRTWTTGFVLRGYAAAGDQAIIKDAVRNVTVCILTGNADLRPVGELWMWPQQIQNLTLDTLTSGQVEVIVK